MFPVHGWSSHDSYFPHNPSSQICSHVPPNEWWRARYFQMVSQCIFFQDKPEAWLIEYRLSISWEFIIEFSVFCFYMQAEITIGRTYRELRCRMATCAEENDKALPISGNNKEVFSWFLFLFLYSPVQSESAFGRTVLNDYIINAVLQGYSRFARLVLSACAGSCNHFSIATSLTVIKAITAFEQFWYFDIWFPADSSPFGELPPQRVHWRRSFQVPWRSLRPL